MRKWQECVAVVCLAAVPVFVMAADLRNAQCTVSAEVVILAAQKARTHHDWAAVRSEIDRIIADARVVGADDRNVRLMEAMFVLMYEAAEVGYTEGSRKQGNMDFYHNVYAARDAFLEACLER